MNEQNNLLLILRKWVIRPCKTKRIAFSCPIMIIIIIIIQVFRNKQNHLELSKFYFPRRFDGRVGHLFQGWCVLDELRVRSHSIKWRTDEHSNIKACRCLVTVSALRTCQFACNKGFQKYLHFWNTYMYIHEVTDLMFTVLSMDCLGPNVSSCNSKIYQTGRMPTLISVFADS